MRGTATRGRPASAVRVCHVLHTLGPGGAQDLLVGLADAAPTAGLTVQVLSLTPTTGQVLADRLAAAGVSVASLELAGRWDPRGLARTRRVLAGWAPDVVHTHGKHADIAAGYAARRLGVPQVSTLHLIEEVEGRGRRIKQLAAAAVRDSSAARIVAVSGAQRDWYLRTFRPDPARVVTVHNGVPRPPVLPAEELGRVRAELGVVGSGLLATMVGLMRWDRGHRELISAAPHIPPDVTLALVGDGPQRPALEGFARRHGGGARIVFVGYRRDVPRLLAASDLVVHPSLADALPTALIHGMAAGRPVVGTRVGGIPELVLPDAGVLVPPGDENALAEAVTDLARDPARRRSLGCAARRRFDEAFEATGWARRLRALYEEVLR